MNWLDTTTAARELGIHPSTLKRKRDINGGFLETGKHYRFKTDAANSCVLWDVETIRQLMHERGIQARQEAVMASTEAKAEQVIRDLPQEGTNG